MPNINQHSRLIVILLWSCLAAAFAVATFVIFHEYKASFNSDAAQNAITARLALQDGSLLPRNWIYANGDLWIVGPRIFAIILYPILGMSYSLIATSDWLSYIYLLLMIYGACRVIAPHDQYAAIIGTIIAAGCLSSANFEVVVGEALYSIYPALALAVFVMVSKLCTDEERTRSSPWTLAMIAIAAGLICITNATRALVTVIAPLLAGWGAAVLTLRGKLPRNKAKSVLHRSIIASCAGALVGIIIYKFALMPGIINSTGAASIAIASKAEIVQHLATLPRAWFTFFLVGDAWQSLSVPLRILQVAVWIFSIVLVVVPVLIVTRARRHPFQVVMLSWITLAGYAIVTAALIVSKSLFASYTSWHYATPATYMAVCIVAVQAGSFVRKYRLPSYIPIACLCIVPVLTISAWQGLPAWKSPSLREHMQLIAELEKQHVGTILATYWNANSITVLSHGAVESYSAKVDPDSTLKRFGQNEPTTITYGSAGTSQAVVLTAEEASPTTWTGIEGELGKPARRLRSGPFEMWIYDRDIVSRVYGIGAAINTSISSDRVGIYLSREYFPPCRAIAPCETYVWATNSGTHRIASAGSKPFDIGIEGVNAAGDVVVQDVGRAYFSTSLAPGNTARVSVALPPTENSNVTRYRLCLLQEYVAWRCDRTNTGKGESHIANMANSNVGPFHAALGLLELPRLEANGREILVTVQVINDGAAAFGSSTSPHGVNLGAHAVNASGNIVENDLARGHLPQILPGDSTSANILLPTDNLIGKRAEIMPVAEGVGWFDKWGTRPLVVGPFERCENGGVTTVCDSAGKPLPTVSKGSD